MFECSRVVNNVLSCEKLTTVASSVIQHTKNGFLRLPYNPKFRNLGLILGAALKILNCATESVRALNLRHIAINKTRLE